MPEFKYSFVGYDPLLHVRASGREVNISPKAAREICSVMKNKRLSEARKLLEDVVALRQAIPFRRYKKKVAHKSSVTGFHAGRYPIKAASQVLEVLKNLEANANFKGLDTDRLVIIHASALPGRRVKAYTPRAYGRSSPSFNTLVHVELIAREA